MAQVPYEFLARWDHQTGVLKGAHVKLFDSITQREGDAQSVAVAGAAGYPLADILTAVEIGAIAALDAERAAHTATRAALDAVLARLAAVA